MRPDEFLKKLEELIREFNNSNNVIIDDIDLNTDILKYTTDKEVIYHIKFRIC